MMVYAFLNFHVLTLSLAVLHSVLISALPSQPSLVSTKAFPLSPSILSSPLSLLPPNNDNLTLTAPPNPPDPALIPQISFPEDSPSIHPPLNSDEKHAALLIIDYLIRTTRARIARSGGRAASVPYQELHPQTGTAMEVSFHPVESPLMRGPLTNLEAIVALEKVKRMIPLWRGTKVLGWDVWVKHPSARSARGRGVVQVLGEGRIWRGEAPDQS